LEKAIANFILISCIAHSGGIRIQKPELAIWQDLFKLKKQDRNNFNAGTFLW